AEFKLPEELKNAIANPGADDKWSLSLEGLQKKFAKVELGQKHEGSSLKIIVNDKNKEKDIAQIELQKDGKLVFQWLATTEGEQEYRRAIRNAVLMVKKAGAKDQRYFFGLMQVKQVEDKEKLPWLFDLSKKQHQTVNFTRNKEQKTGSNNLFL